MDVAEAYLQQPDLELITPAKVISLDDRRRRVKASSGLGRAS